MSVLLLSPILLWHEFDCPRWACVIDRTLNPITTTTFSVSFSFICVCVQWSLLGWLSVHGAVMSVDCSLLMGLLGGSVKLVCTSECPLSSFAQEIAVSFPGQFRSRRCIMLCITVEVEPRIVQQYKWHHCCSCKKYWGNETEDGEKRIFAPFFGWPEDHDFMEKCLLGHPIAQATRYCLLPDTLWLQASKNAFKVGSVKFAFHCEASTHWK